MKQLWCTYQHPWSSEYCNDILNRLDFSNFSDGTVRGGVVNKEVRRVKSVNISGSERKFKDVFINLWIAAKEMNSMYFGLDISRLNFLQILKYDESDQGKYDIHHDVFWIVNSQYHRKLSCVVQLSDVKNYKGGEFYIDAREGKKFNTQDVINQGTLIFFPGFVPHRVSPVTQGTRFSLVAWFEGPKWK